MIEKGTAERFTQYMRKYPELYEQLANIVKENIPKSVKKPTIIDLGVGPGLLSIQMRKKIKNAKIIGVDPNKELVNQDKDIHYGFCHKMPFEKESFDFITLISVFEHIHPTKYQESISEINRVLRSNGLLFVQMPNPKFPVEFHTRLPFFGYLPESVQQIYLDIFKIERSFWSIDMKFFTNLAIENGFEVLKTENYVYPKEVIPKRFRPFYFITQVFPMGHYSLLVKK